MNLSVKKPESVHANDIAEFPIKLLSITRFLLSNGLTRQKLGLIIRSLRPRLDSQALKAFPRCHAAPIKA